MTHLNIVEKFKKVVGAANGETLPTVGVGVVYYNPSASRTGVILEAGLQDGQMVSVVNVGANAFTFAAPATSNVALGADLTIEAGGMMPFVYSKDTGHWHTIIIPAAE